MFKLFCVYCEYKMSIFTSQFMIYTQFFQTYIVVESQVSKCLLHHVSARCYVQCYAKLVLDYCSNRTSRVLLRIRFLFKGFSLFVQYSTVIG